MSKVPSEPRPEKLPLVLDTDFYQRIVTEDAKIFIDANYPAFIFGRHISYFDHWVLRDLFEVIFSAGQRFEKNKIEYAREKIEYERKLKAIEQEKRRKEDSRKEMGQDPL